MTVYIVTEGEYSDYRIMAVFTREDLANLFAELYGSDVEEYEPDQDAEQIQDGLVWAKTCVTLNSFQLRHTYITPDQQEPSFAWYRERGGGANAENFYDFPTLTVSVSVKKDDNNWKERALKAATERARQYKAEHPEQSYEPKFSHRAGGG